MTTDYTTLSVGTCNVVTMSVTTMKFLIEIMSTLKVIKSYIKQNLTLVVMGLFNKFHMK